MGFKNEGLNWSIFQLCKFCLNILKTNEIRILTIDSSFTASLLTLRALRSTRNDNTIGLVHTL